MITEKGRYSLDVLMRNYRFWLAVLGLILFAGGGIVGGLVESIPEGVVFGVMQVGFGVAAVAVALQLLANRRRSPQ